MPIHYERENTIYKREDHFFPAENLVEELERIVEKDEPLNREIFEKMYQNNLNKFQSLYGPEYLVIIARNRENFKLVEKIADPVIRFCDSIRKALIFRHQ